MNSTGTHKNFQWKWGFDTGGVREATLRTRFSSSKVRERQTQTGRALGQKIEQALNVEIVAGEPKKPLPL